MSDSPDEIKLDALSHGGEAVARRQPVTFVPYGAPGDVVTLHRTEQKKNFARAWIRQVVTPSPDRTEAPCVYHFKPGDEPSRVCGGCDWQHLKYASQLEAKRQLVIESFQRIGRIAKPNVEAAIGVQNPGAAPQEELAGSPWRYRNKVQVPFAQDNAGQLIGGFYAPGSHTIIPFDDCIVQPKESVKIFKIVLDWFQKNPAPVYDENSHRGWLRHVLIRTNSAGEAMVTVVTNDDSFPNALGFVKNLVALSPAVQSVFQNVNTRTDHVILGPEWRHIDGKHFLTEKIGGLKFRLSPGSFFQIHHAMAEQLYRKVEDMASPHPEASILELYAGVGAIAQILARRAKYVWGVEENPNAVADAIESAKWNNLRNVRFLLSKCETALARGRFKKGPSDRLGAVVLDPPRAGCAEHVLRGVMRLQPERIVYVSCDPATLARDARYLSTGGYHLQRCTPVDLFPQTSHIESASLFIPTAPAKPIEVVSAPAQADVPQAPAPFPPRRPDRPFRPNYRPGDRRPSRPDRPFRSKETFRPGGERPSQPDRPFRPNKPFRPGGERPGQPDRPFRPNKPFRPGGERPGQPDRPFRPNKPFRPGGERPGQPDRPFRPNKPFRPGGERPGQPDRPFRPNKPFRPGGERPGQPDRPFRPNKPFRPGGDRPQQPGQPFRPKRPFRPGDQRPPQSDRPFRPNRPFRPGGERPPQAGGPDTRRGPGGPPRPPRRPNRPPWKRPRKD